MTKNNSIDRLSGEMKVTKREAEMAVDLVLESITEALVKGEKVDLRGFGSFQVSGKKERQGRNPRTGETMTIAARNVAVFKPSKELSGRLNGGSEDEPGRRRYNRHSRSTERKGTRTRSTSSTRCHVATYLLRPGCPVGNLFGQCLV